MARRKVRWSQEAWTDLAQASAYIAQSSPNNAAAFVQTAIRRAKSLRDFPLRHAKVSELGDDSIRETLVFKHRLVYQITADEIRIIGFIHGARDFLSVWKPRTQSHGE